ncbi:MAG: cytidylate kinase-like family protein [Deltaproteobacteria bacterium]|nr:cytidylate kinase-like family protein [Deltaproteobacteria bacterium]
MENVYEAGDVIILGWGSQCLLKGKPDTLHVRLIKDNDLKTKELIQAENLSPKAAKDFIDREEGDLKAYVRQYFNEDWNDAHLYDLIVDMGKISVEKAVDMICDNVKHKTE